MGGLSHAEAPARRARSELRGHAPPAIQSTASTSDVYTSRGFESAPYNETDTEDPTSADANLWYVGLNRTAGSSARVGTGVNKACLVLSTTTAPSAATLAALCP